MSDFGTELRRLLDERGMSTYDAARNVPCSASYITHLCAGRKRPSPCVVERLEAILAADGVLTAAAPGPAARKRREPPPPPRTLAMPAEGSWASSICAAVLSPTDAARRAAIVRAPRSGQQLATAAAAILRASLASDYARLAAHLPGLIGECELALFDLTGADDAPLRMLLSDIYSVAGWTLIKADAPSMAWTAAQRALQLAEEADDALRSAAATRCVAEVHMRAGSYDEAARTAFLAATYLDTMPTRRAAVVSMRGAALLSASAAAARRGDGREARTSLRAAAMCAERIGKERTDLGTVFGPVNVAIHRVAIPLELGACGEAARNVPDVRLERLPAGLAERRARFLIDAARSHAGVRDDQAALGALTEAEQIAPDELRNHRLTRMVLSGLMTRERRSSDLRALAGRCGALAR